ncbi:hypothetical protein [Bremerella alba]|uniref:Uncharacterized protein n=1 Tax=Bremerella alba TaxID=980252 RepID=A0A7V8V7Y1_9BACT|nr:hypothetical protein [Bremerella alba]MBA2116614.1 hypothetical protein [Bremerella alba]
MRDFIFQVVRDAEDFVVNMGTLEWTLAFALVVGFGIFCLQGVGSKTRS